MIFRKKKMKEKISIVNDFISKVRLNEILELNVVSRRRLFDQRMCDQCDRENVIARSQLGIRERTDE